MTVQTWSVWYPKAGATGVLIARARIDAIDAVLVHASGDVTTVEVHDPEGNLVAFGRDLARTEPSPMALYSVKGRAVTREDLWPTDADIGRIVILPGGEAGVLKAWWHAEDRKQWRWQLELYNRIG